MEFYFVGSDLCFSIQTGDLYISFYFEWYYENNSGAGGDYAVHIENNGTPLCQLRLYEDAVGDHFFQLNIAGDSEYSSTEAISLDTAYIVNIKLDLDVDTGTQWWYYLAAAGSTATLRDSGTTDPGDTSDRVVLGAPSGAYSRDWGFYIDKLEIDSSGFIDTS